MIRTLDQLTMARFIDLICGDMDVLQCGPLILSRLEVSKTARNIILEYRRIADDAGMNTYLSVIEETMIAKTEFVIFSSCDALISAGDYSDSRVIMEEYGINADRMTDLRLAAEVKSRLERARSTLVKLRQEAYGADVSHAGIRSSFDAMTASLMAYFKFQIDISTMKATVYAHLVARYNLEVKTQLAAMKKRLTA